MLNTIRGLILILAAVQFTPSALGDVIVANTGAPASALTLTTPQALAGAGFQSPSVATEITSVTAALLSDGGVNVTMALYASSAGLPSVQIATLGSLILPPGPYTATFTPSAPVALLPSSPYFLVLSCSGCVSGNFSSWSSSVPEVAVGLPGATVSTPVFASGDGGNSWSHTPSIGTFIFTVNGNIIAPSTSRTLDTPFQVRYASNLTHGDSVVNITNTGANGGNLYGPGFGKPAGNICVNVYAFSPDEQLISCCSCLVTPNGLVHLTANNDLVSNTLTGIRPDSIVIKLVATATGSKEAPPPDVCEAASVTPGTPTFDGSTCANSAALAGTEDHQVAGGMLAWGTTLHSASSVDPNPTGPFSITESPFVPAYLSKDELKSIRNRCANIIGNGSTFGQCRSCRLGGLGGTKL